MPIKANPVKPFKFLAVALCLAIALYTGYWYWLARSFETVIHQWQANMAVKQASLTYDSLTVSGFPGTVSVNVHNMNMTQSRYGTWSFPLFQIRVNPLNMNALEVIAPQTNHFNAAGDTHELTMAFGKLRLSHAYNTGARTQDISLAIDDMAFEKTTDSAALDHFLIDLTVTPPLYKPISSYAELKRWRDHNGTVRLNRLLLERGSIKVESNGDLTLSTAFQPRFNGTISVLGVIELLTQLQEEKIINEQMAGLVKSFITMLNGGKTPQVNQPLVAPIVINDSDMLTIGPFPIFKIPTIEWNAL